MRKLIFFLLALLFVVSIAACSHEEESTLPPVASGSVVVTPQAPIPTGVEPSIRGFVTRINYSAESTEILVEYYHDENEEPAYQYDKALVKIDGNTAIATDRDETLAVSSLTVGSTVEVWFNDTPADSFPMLAYGQAVRVITTSDNLCGVTELPQLSVVSGASAATVITDAQWKDRTYSFDPFKALLDRTLGAHLTVAPGDTVTLNFSRRPKTVEVLLCESTISDGVPVELADNSRMTVPENIESDVYIRVKARFYQGEVEYGFSLTPIVSGE